MKLVSINIESVQHIRSLKIDVDLSSNKIMCLVGRNGVGKTTLIRAMRNLSSSDTFLKTANPSIFSKHSQITYRIDDYEVVFSYDEKIRSLNCKEDIPASIRDSISAELPMPYGARFNYFRNAGNADSDIRRAVVLGTYETPHELIEFLASIYSTDKYNKLVEVRSKGQSYYSILLEEDMYIREDYLSSGEYFLINLYRTIKSDKKLIVIDEIDLSLDAAAQAKLVAWLRSFCEKYDCSVLFTTHSLAIMRTLDSSELSYMEQEDGETVHRLASYSYVKARLFGFRGWDRYILTEDVVLNDFIEYVIRNRCASTFYQYKVIHVGGAYQVTDLLKRNAIEGFLAQPQQVIAVLDGDQRDVGHAQHEMVHFIPIESVEKAIFEHYLEDDFPYKVPCREFTGPRDLFSYIKQTKLATSTDLYEYLCTRHATGIDVFAQGLNTFLRQELPVQE